MEDTTSTAVVLYFFNQTCSFFYINCNFTTYIYYKYVNFACDVKHTYLNNSSTVQRWADASNSMYNMNAGYGPEVHSEYTYPTHIQTLMSV